MNTVKEMNSGATNARDKRFLTLIAVLSVLIPIVVAVLFYIPKVGGGKVDVSFLPPFYAFLNFLTAIALVIGYKAVKSGNVIRHRAAMLTAFGLSSVFLVSYVVYHLFGERTIYGGEGVMKYVYYFILITHIVLAVVIVPLVLLSVYFGITNQLSRHRRISRWTYPTWLYVAITGVVVYLMISPYYT